MDSGLRLAVLGATGHIGKALTARFVTDHTVTLYARRPEVAASFLDGLSVEHTPEVRSLESLGAADHDALVNCIGIGDPASIRDGSVFDEVTNFADDLALGYLEDHPATALINISSGAAHGSDFQEPIGGNGPAGRRSPIVDPYGEAKHASESRHRMRADLHIVDLRVFGFFSRYIDPTGTYLMADVVRSLRSGVPLLTGPADIMRDYVAPSDLASLVCLSITQGRRNTAYDVYSAQPVSKFGILDAFVDRFGLRYSVTDAGGRAAFAPVRRAYYSLDHRATELGYRPTMTSLATLEQETLSLLDMTG